MVGKNNETYVDCFKTEFTPGVEASLCFIGFRRPERPSGLLDLLFSLLTLPLDVLPT